MEPTAPARSTAPGRTQGTRKLRESCISCSRAKVKCNKEKPTCSRCVRRALPCEYMVSRRTGRNRAIGVERPSTTTAATTATTATQTADPSASTRISNVPINLTTLPQSAAIETTAGPSQKSLPAVTDHPTAMTARSSPKATQLHSPPRESDLWNTIISPVASGSTDLSSLLSVNTDIGQLFAALSPSQLDDPNGIETNPDPHRQGPLSAADSPSSLMWALDNVDTIPLPGSTTKADPCCLSICLDMLMRLFPNARMACERPGGENGPGKLCTIESVIEDNKEILATVQTVLECHCSEDEYVATLVSLVVFKVMGWYVAVARDQSSDPVRDGEVNWASGGNSNDHTRRPSAASFEEQVLHLPTVVGSYCVDGHHQSRMAAQLVLSELHRVQRLVTLVAHRLEAIRQRSLSMYSSSSSSSSSSMALSGAPIAGTTPLSSTTLTHLEDDLRKRLRAVCSETISILQRA
ncbi:aflatoxin regulatory protein-domain-containing protein [Aspergillus varians]